MGTYKFGSTYMKFSGNMGWKKLLILEFGNIWVQSKYVVAKFKAVKFDVRENGMGTRWNLSIIIAPSEISLGGSLDERKRVPKSEIS